MARSNKMNARERLVFHVQELERVEALKRDAAECARDAYDAAKAAGFDQGTLKVVLKLRRMTPEQRRERKALESIYLAALGMLEGEALSDEARRRIDEQSRAPEKSQEPQKGTDDPGERREQLDRDEDQPTPAQAPREDPAPPAQPPLVLKTPEEAREEGSAAAEAGKRIYDNPYGPGDPCRAAWDEGWCAQKKSHGMETPAAFQRRSAKPAEKADQPEQDKDGKSKGAGAEEAA